MTALDKLRAAYKPRHESAAIIGFIAFVFYWIALDSAVFSLYAITFALGALAALFWGYYQEVRRRHASH